MLPLPFLCTKWISEADVSSKEMEEELDYNLHSDIGICVISAKIKPLSVTTLAVGGAADSPETHEEHATYREPAYTLLFWWWWNFRISNISHQ